MNTADLEAIRAAVAEAEQNTSGEIVPYLVEESDGYPSALWKGTALGAFAGALLAEAIYFLGDFWGGMIPLWIALPAAAGGAVGFLLSAYVPAIKRWMAGDGLLDLRTRQRAEMAFLEEEVFRTRDRTGILLFLSLFEHRVIVIGDSGINQQVEQGQWDGIVKTMAAGIRAGRPGDALVEGIRQCGELLERHGVAIKPDDLDELSNELRRGDR
jgi:putative membrane protein